MHDPSNSWGIYGIVNNVTGRLYIGMTALVFAKRWITHVSSLKYGKHSNPELQRDWLELGREAFDFSIIESFQGRVDESGLMALERHHIATSDCWLYNTNNGIVYWNDKLLIRCLYEDCK
jgi:group I intron endonuclease